MPFKTYILQPKSGRGMITSRTTQNLQEYADSCLLLSNLLLKDAAYELRSGDSVNGNISSASGPIWGVHYYNAIDPTNASATPTTLQLTLSGEATNGSGTSTLRDSTAGGTTVTVNGNSFQTTDPSDVFFLNIKNRCFITGRKMAAGVVPTILQRYPSRASYQWGKPGPTANMTYSAIQNATSANSKIFYQAAGGGVTAASASVTKISGTWDGGTAWVGKTVYLNGVPYTIVSYTPTTGPMTIATAWVDDGSGPHVNFRVDYGEISWPNGGPQYAYAYYNPTTGHITNTCPVLQVSEQDIQNVRVQVASIQTTADTNYTRIVLFRTALDNGGVLLPLLLDTSGTNPGSCTIDTTPSSAGFGMIVNNGPGAVSYVDFQPDSNLGQVLGRLPYPTLNNPPPADAKFLAYWDERVWTVSAALPSRLYFSGNAAQIPLGVAEECFPFLNFRDIPTDSGAITGLKVVGTSLLVATDKYLHFVNGGPGEDTYSLSRISARGTGVTQHAFDEHPGDSSEQAASAIYLSRDKRLWRQFPGGRIDDIGWPIQDKLDQISLNQNKPAIVRVFQVGKACLLAVGLKPAAASSYSYLFYDFDEQTWHSLGYAGGFISSDFNQQWSGVWAGIHYLNSISGEFAFSLGSSSTSISTLMTDSTFGPITGSELQSQWLDGGNKEAKKTFQSVDLYVSDTTQTYIVDFYADDLFTNHALLAQQTVAGTPRAMGAGVLRFNMTSDSRINQWHSMLLRMRLPGTGVPIPAPGAKIYRAVVNYTIESTGEAGSGQ